MFNHNTEIKSLWVRQLKKDWENANYFYFKDRMQLPAIDILASERILGRWHGGPERTLSISEHLIMKYPWGYAQEVLYHEMAHQFTEEILGITDAVPHGKIFVRVCREHGFDHSASGDIHSWVRSRCKHKESGENRIIDKIHKLLALATSSNPNEAQLAMSRAQELLTKYNISLLESNAKLKYIHKQIGKIGRKNPVKSLVGGILIKFFFVKGIWVSGYDRRTNKEGRVLEIYGAPENVEMAEYVHDFLHNISEVLWTAHKKEKKVSGNRHRRTFIYGLLKGFYKKLEEETAKNKSYELSKGALVLWEDHALNEYYRRRNPKIQKGKTSFSQSSKDAYLSGIHKGKNLVIHKGIHDRHSGQARFISLNS